MLLGAVQGAMLSVLLFTKKANHAGNAILSAVMLALSLDVFHSFYILFGYYNEFPQFAGLTYPFPFLYGPAFYLYTRLISSDINKLGTKQLLHFIPFTIVLIYGFIFVYMQSSEFKYALIRGDAAAYVPGLRIVDYLKPVHGIIYVILIIRVIKNFNRKIKESYSNTERINLNWLRHLAAGLSVIWGVVLLSYILNTIAPQKIEMDHFIYMTASVLIYAIGYLSLRQPQILEQADIKTGEPDKPQENEVKAAVTAEITEIPSDEHGAENTESASLGITGKEKAKRAASYRRSGLSDSEAEECLSRLLKIMETGKPYLNPELTLRELAAELPVSSHNLSEILNSRLHLNFYDFINRYRVEEVKKRLNDGEAEKYNLLSIAFDSGFNSKSTFNTIFKRQTGSTPSQYKKLKVNSSEF